MAQDRLVVNVADMNGAALGPYAFGVEGLPGVIAMHARTRNAPSSVMDYANDDLAKAHGVYSEKGIVAVVAVDAAAYVDPIAALEARLKGYFAHVKATFHELPKMRILFEPSMDLKERYGVEKMQGLVASALMLDRGTRPVVPITYLDEVSFGTESTMGYSYGGSTMVCTPAAQLSGAPCAEYDYDRDCDSPEIPQERDSDEEAKFRYFRTPSPWGTAA